MGLNRARVPGRQCERTQTRSSRSQARGAEQFLPTDSTDIKRAATAAAVWIIPLRRRRRRHSLAQRRRQSIHPAIPVRPRVAESWLTLTTTIISSDSHDRVIDP